MNQVANTNTMLLPITKRKADSADKMPAGISRIAVRGFNASKWRSKYRLKAMAALRAVTIQTNTSKPFCNKTGFNKPCMVPAVPLSAILATGIARKKPIKAKGMAKMVCENFTRLRYFLTVVKSNYFKTVRSVIAHIIMPAATEMFNECLEPN